MEREPKKLHRIVGIAMLLTLLLGVMAGEGCGHERPAAENKPTIPTLDLATVKLPVPNKLVHTPVEAMDYVGSGVCAGCHPNEAAKHQQTAHARAVRLASVAKDGAWFRQKEKLTDPDLQTTYTPEVDGKRLLIRTSGNGTTTTTEVNVAIGSGSHGITYMAVHPDGTCLTPPISTYREKGKLHWNWTPGSREAEELRDPQGRTISEGETASCVGCHSTSVQARLQLNTDRLGIGCERCHGPGATHLQRVTKDPKGVKAGTVESGIPRLGRLSAEQSLALCNTCHASQDDPDPNGLPSDLARAQPQALQMSRCFQQSQGKMTCVTCHDPHAVTETSVNHYERVCVSCHTPQQSKATLCKVNRESGCLECHLSKQTLKAFNTIVFTNHWIRKTLPAPALGSTKTVP